MNTVEPKEINMVAPIVAGLLQVLASKGMGLLASAIEAKGKDFVESKIGVKIPDDASQLTADKLMELKMAEMEHEETLLGLAIEKAKVNLEESKLDVENTKSAREMNSSIQTSANASRLAKEAAYYLDFLVIGSTLLLAGLVVFKAIPDANKEIVYIVFGALLGQCTTILNFHRGTSSSSKSKDDTVQLLVSRGGK